MSPKIARELDVPANLDGSFLLIFSFAIRDDAHINPLNENRIMAYLLDELEKTG